MDIPTPPTHTLTYLQIFIPSIRNQKPLLGTPPQPLGGAEPHTLRLCIILCLEGKKCGQEEEGDRIWGEGET